MTVVAVITSWLLNLRVIPRYYQTKRYRESVFIFIAIFILSTYVQVLFVFSIFIIIRFDLESVIPRMQDVLVIIANTWLIILAGVSISQIRQASERARVEETLKREKSEIELQMLKAQINPHFLFNTLNSIYILSKKKSDEAPALVLKLSQMLDYLLYEGNSSYVEIKKEIDFIRDYIDLEKIRYGKKLHVQVAVELINPNRSIKPMLFVPLVENAFKHGVKHERKKAKVEIKISDNQGIIFSVSNSVPPVTHKNEKGGIGLTNLKGRLDKLYGQKYSLDIQETEENFRVVLTIMDEL
jgi:two-component system, LytTR family, sensor kinase